MKKLILPFEMQDFIEFMYSSMNSSDCRNEVGNMLESLRKTGKYVVDIRQEFKNCGYFPIGLLSIDEQLDNELREYFEDDEIQDRTGEINGRPYEIVLVGFPEKKKTKK